MKNITVATNASGVMVATLDMPGRPFNVFSEAMMADLAALIDQIERDTAAGNAPAGLVITSGKSSFVAGADLAMIQDFGAMRFSATWQEMRDRYSYLGQLFRRLEKLPVPTVAAVNGLALGGGLELAMACHGRVCADSKYIQLGLPEVLLGLLPGAGGTQRLPRYVGTELGTKMLLDGKPLTADQALASGLVDALAAPEELIAAAVEMVLGMKAGARWDTADFSMPDSDRSAADEDFRSWACEVAGVSARDSNLYPAVDAIINCLTGGHGKSIDAACNVEWDIFVDLMSDPVSSNMVTTCFLSKTAATKNSLAGVPEIAAPASFAVIGGGDLGKKPFKKMTQESEVDADFYLADLASSDVRADLLVQDLRVTQSALSDKPVLRLSGTFAESEVLELAPGKSAEDTALAMAVLQRSGKPIVVSRSAKSVNEVLISAMRSAYAGAGVSAQNFYTQCEAVGLEWLAQTAIEELAEPARSLQVTDRALGLPLLLGLSLDVYAWLKNEFGDSANDALLAGIDLLAVYGVEFPKWTGGPLSCLTMFQRGELKYSGAQALLAQLEWRFKNELGYKLAAA
ncbi:enoyl-CoA hydratase-related protein [Zhongshania guokunii]|uniref:Enoyl-CoA hydratase-related protein n=1 Tax=Zhongshania guokunii TaxID=641783 RepID=A0ABV3U1N6_9GAMM